ncbi:SDR family NAD(P)-dependent oxidoreductase [Pseudarthrobacter sulfonivorans]|uniref:SDR family NAD(P)-dependent oxidoreductase n=1 Tax=Pseudarthrobacter sulfonivorans TaxID=121292 RepID=UPI00168B976C|nr:SDR family NAD(P)-dependent oxidoreductase [Pseudarthrobacter sulfonivorans]
MSDLTGRRIIVTGGASGMGAGLVRALPEMGASVVSLDVEESVGGKIAAEAGATFVRCDVSDEQSVTAAFDAAVDVMGGLDVLVHLAGIAPTATAIETDADLWDRVMRINARGTFLTNQAAFRHLKGHGGRIIDFASGAGMNGYPRKGAYAASKGAVLAWVRTCAVEWGPFGISVNAVSPMIWTPMYDKTRSEMTPEQLSAHDEMMARTIPMGGRLGDVRKDLVPVIAFLAGEGSGFMTGQTFVVDGGRIMTR